VLAPTLHTLQNRSVSSQSQIAQIDVLRMYPRLPKSPSPHPLTQASQSLHVVPHGPALCNLIETLSIMVMSTQRKEMLNAATQHADHSPPLTHSKATDGNATIHLTQAPLSERDPKRVPRNCAPAPRRDGVFRITIFGELVCLLDRQQPRRSRHLFQSDFL
jgi:hypothetical protein